MRTSADLSLRSAPAAARAEQAAETGDLASALRRGEDLLEAERYVQALQQADIVLESYPEDRRAKALRHEALLFIAIDAINAREFAKAERLLRAILQSDADHPRAMRLLATVAAQLGVYGDAELLLERVLGFEPDNRPARCDYVSVLSERRRFDRALVEISTLLAADPDNLEYQMLKGTVLSRMGRAADAVEAYERVAAARPNQAQIHVNIAHSLKTLGRQGEAIAQYRMATKAAVGFGEPWWSLANLKTYRFDDVDVAAMIAAEEAALGSAEDHVHRCFALGKAFADRGEPDRSMLFYTIGNAAKRAASDYSSAATRAMVDRLIETCTPGLFERHAGGGCPDPAPIFIVGLPRSGSTLVEQVLASHSLVDGTMELSDIIGIAASLSGKTLKSDRSLYPGVLATLEPGQLKRLGETYIADTACYRGHAPRFTDKMPNNFAHIGLIRLILPNARIIDVRRHPLDACFSGFRQLFARGQEFSYSLEDIGAYYRDYVRLMDHYDRVLPGGVLHVSYEAVVGDFETQVRRILDFCGLPFEPACLRFFKTERAIHTASSEQVRQPIYDSGIGQWRPFERHLAGLKVAIGADVIGRYETMAASDTAA